MTTNAFDLKRLRTKLDRIIQDAMGWTNSHLHAITIEDKRYGAQERDDWEIDPHLQDEKRYAIRDVLGDAGFEFTYVYDFGDDWMHRIIVERIEVATPINNWVMCVAGENACPPENVGGPPGYEAFRVVMADKSHTEFADYWNRIGGPFDTAAFDMNLANQRIRKLR